MLRPDKLLISLACHSPKGDGSCLITRHVTMQGAVERPLVRQISPDKNVNYRYTTAAFLVAPGDYPTCLRQASLPNPGLRYVVLTHPETGPYMLFLFVGS